MQNRFTIIAGQVHAGQREEWAWQVVSPDAEIACGFEPNILEALESAASALGYYIDTHAAEVGSVTSVEVALTADAWPDGIGRRKAVTS